MVDNKVVCYGMEFDENELTILSMKACDLVSKVSDEIEGAKINVCEVCLGNAQIPMQEKQRLIAIKDSLKDVDSMIVYLQRLQSCQQQRSYEAISKLEESRVHLMDCVKYFQENGRQRLDVIEELNVCFGNEKKEKRTEELRKKSWFFNSCIRGLFNPLNWHRIIKTAIKLAVISVSLSSTYNFCRYSLESRCALSSNLSVVGRNDFLAIDSHDPLDVSYGMG